MGICDLIAKLSFSKLKFLNNKFLQAKFPKRIELVARKEMDPTTSIGICDLIAKLSFSLRIMNLKRSLYSTVKTTPRTTVIRTKRLTLFPCLNRAIWCFEKNADVKKRPIEEMKNTLSIEPRIGLFFTSSIGLFFTSAFFSKHQIALLRQGNSVNLLVLTTVVLGVVFTVLYRLRFRFIILREKLNLAIRSQIPMLVVGSISFLATSSILFGNLACRNLLLRNFSFEIPLNQIIV